MKLGMQTVNEMRYRLWQHRTVYCCSDDFCCCCCRFASEDDEDQEAKVRKATKRRKLKATKDGNDLWQGQMIGVVIRLNGRHGRLVPCRRHGPDPRPYSPLLVVLLLAR